MYTRITRNTFELFQRCLKSNLVHFQSRQVRIERCRIIRWIDAIRLSKGNNEISTNSIFKSLQTKNEKSEIQTKSSKRRRKSDPVPTRGDRHKIVTEINQFQRLSDAVTPLASLTYDEQLKLKYRQNREILIELGEKLKEIKSPVKRDVRRLPCVYKDIIPSPVTDKYRNKDEFRIKKGFDGNLKTVGFLVGNMTNGTAVCVNPTKLINIKPSHVLVGSKFQEYIRKSKLPVCDLFHDGGNWRGITVRSNLKGDLMAIVTLHPQNLTEDELKEEKESLKEYFVNGSGKECNLKSLYFQACRHSRCTREDSPFDLLFGDEFIYEELLGLKFRISPDSFFQVNSLGAGQLYKSIRQLCDIDENTVVVDVCSGTGTIGLLLGSQARSVIGVESVHQAVEDAKANAKLNGINNAVFYHGRAEKILPDLISKLDSHNIVAVVNPTRSGLHREVVRTLRACEKISQLVYISCNPRGEAMTNLLNFSARECGKWQGRPFIPKLAVAMDMFPHTEHCELVIVLDRNKPCNDDMNSFNKYHAKKTNKNR